MSDSFINGIQSLMLPHVLVHRVAAPRRIVRNDRPIVVVLERSADVHHEVDATAASEKLAAGHVVLFSVRLWHGFEFPVVFIVAWINAYQY